MNKRVVLTDDDLELIRVALDQLKGKSIGMNPNVYPEYALASRQRFSQLEKKLKSQHPRSVETSGVSGNGDTNSLAHKEK